MSEFEPGPMDELQAPSDQGRLWAILSYAGFFIGLPVGLVPLLMREHTYALRHAKTATAVWLVVFALWTAYGLITAVTCGLGALLFPIPLLAMIWPLVVAVHGLILTINGQWDEPIGGFGLGDRLFASIAVKPKDEPPFV